MLMTERTLILQERLMNVPMIFATFNSATSLNVMRRFFQAPLRLIYKCPLTNRFQQSSWSRSFPGRIWHLVSFKNFGAGVLTDCPDYLCLSQFEGLCFEYALGWNGTRWSSFQTSSTSYSHYPWQLHQIEGQSWYLAKVDMTSFHITDENADWSYWYSRISTSWNVSLNS